MRWCAVEKHFIFRCNSISDLLVSSGVAPQTFMPYLTRSKHCSAAPHSQQTHSSFAALDGKGKALLHANEVRELVWNIQNHPSSRNRSDSLEMLFKAITCTRNIDDHRVTEAFGTSLQSFIHFIVESVTRGDMGASDVEITSPSHLDVFRHLMVSFTPVQYGIFVLTMPAAGRPHRCHDSV